MASCGGCGLSYKSKREELYDDEEFVCCKRIGRSVLICGKKRSQFPFHMFVGPDWPCMLVTYLLITVPTVLFINNVARLWGPALVAVSVLLLVVTLSLFSLTACSNPGVIFVPRASEESEAVPTVANASVADEEQGLAPQRAVEIITYQQHHQLHQPSVETENGVHDRGNASRIAGDITIHQSDNGVVTDELLVGCNHRGAVNNLASNSPQPNQSPQQQRRSIGTGATITSTSISISSSSSLVRTAGYSAHIECGICKIDRPRFASHCHECGVCIENLDHHCPWTGKCIGKENISNFWRFLWSLSILIGFVVVFVIVTAAFGMYIFDFQ